MMPSLILNVLIAMIWTLLTEITLVAVALGFVLGFGLLAAFPDVWGSREYVRRMLAGVAFFGVFAQEFGLASWEVLRISLTGNMTGLRPRVLTYDVTGLSRFEILLLSHCISLTPGTTTVDVSADFTRLTLHALDAPDPDALRRTIDTTLKRGILAFTR